MADNDRAKIGLCTSDLYRELTPTQLQAAQAAVRRTRTDTLAFADLLGIKLTTAEALLGPLRCDTTLNRIVLLSMLAVLKRAPMQFISLGDTDDCILTFRLTLHCGTVVPAADLTIQELNAVGAALRDDPVEEDDLAAFLGASTAATRVVLSSASEPQAIDHVLAPCLLLRLHGFQVQLPELYASACAVLQHSTTLLRRATAH